MNKKIVAGVLTAVLLVALLPVFVYADDLAEIESYEEHIHCICGASDCSEDYHDSTQVWTEWADTEYLPSSSGCYYLTEDVQLTDTWSVCDDISLCLNGHIIKAAEDERTIEVETDCTLIITDCNSLTEYYFDNSGNYYILSDVQTETTTTLYGGTIYGGAVDNVVSYYDDGSNGANVYVCPGAQFIMNAGSIVGGYGSDHAGAVCVGSDGYFEMNGTANIEGNFSTSSASAVYLFGTFTMNGGSIQYNTNMHWGAVSAYGPNSVFTMNGGSINNNFTLYSCAGVQVADGSAYLLGGDITNNTAANGDVKLSRHWNSGGVGFSGNGNITLGGSLTITDNTCKGIDSNLYLPSGKIVEISDSVEPTTMVVGVTTGATPVYGHPVDVSCVNSEDFNDYFVSDDPNCKIYNTGSDDDQTVILSVHEHSWNYATDSNDTATLVAWCDEDMGHSYCEHYSAENSDSITIVQPELSTYGEYGKSAEATIKDGKSTLGELTELPDIQYYENNGDGTWAKLSAAPTNAGSYRASITVDTDKTAYVEYTINKLKVNIPTKVETQLVYNGKVQTGVALPENSVYTLSGNTATDASENLCATASLVDKDNYEWNVTNPTSDDQQISWSIAKRTVTLTSNSASKAYDGKALTCEYVQVGGEGFADGEGATCNFTGSQTEVGSSDNTFTYSLFANTKADNYKISVVYGKLTVNQATADNSNVPDTGDSNNMRIYMVIIVACLTAAGIVFVARKVN